MDEIEGKYGGGNDVEMDLVEDDCCVGKCVTRMDMG